MKVLMVLPPFMRFLHATTKGYQFPLSLGYLATVLENNGYTAHIYDAEIELHNSFTHRPYQDLILHHIEILSALENQNHYVWKEIEEKIKWYQPDILGVSVISRKYPVALRVAEIAKRVNPEIKVVFGNHHPTLFPEKVIQQPNVDYVVVGEGEITILELVRMIERGTDPAAVDGIVYKKNGKIFRTSPREKSRDLDVYPIPNRNLLLDEEHVDRGFFGNLITARGCPYPCTYCGANNIWEDKVRFRSVDNIMIEMKMLYEEFGTREFHFIDDSFTMKPKRIYELCDRIRSNFPEPVTWVCTTRLDLLNDDLLDTMGSAGCTGIATGVETGNSDILANLDRKLTTDFIKRQGANIQKHGIHWTGFFLIGVPGERKEQMYDTLNFMKEISPDFSFIAMYLLGPNTGLYQKLLSEKKISPDMDWSTYSRENIEYFFVEGMSQEEFQEVALDIIRQFDQHNMKKEQKWKEPIRKYNQASILKSSRNLDQSQKIFVDILNDNSASARKLHGGAHFHLGEIYQQEGNTLLAVQEFQKCLDVNPNHLKSKKYLDALPRAEICSP